MKKFFYLAALTLSICVNAQTQIQTLHSQIRLANVQPGASSDSVLVRGADKIIKFVPQSQIASGGGVGNLQSVLDKGSDAVLTTENSQFFVSISANGTALSSQDNSFQFPNGSVKHSTVQVQPDISFIRHNAISGSFQLSAFEDGCELKSENNEGGSASLLIEMPLDSEVRRYVIPAVGSVGTKNIATEEYVDNAISSSGAAQSLQQTLENGNVSTLPIYIENGENFVLELGKPYTDNQFYFNFSDRGNNTDFPDTQSVQLNANIEEGVNINVGDLSNYWTTFNFAGDGLNIQSSDNSNNAVNNSASLRVGSGVGFEYLGNNRPAFFDAPVKMNELLIFDNATEDKFNSLAVTDNRLSIKNNFPGDNSEFIFDINSGAIQFYSFEGAVFSISPSNIQDNFSFYWPAAESGTLITREETESLMNGLVIVGSAGTVTSGNGTNIYIFENGGTFTPNSATPFGKVFKIRNNSATLHITVDPEGALTINGAATRSVSPGKTLEIVRTNSNFSIIGEY